MLGQLAALAFLDLEGRVARRILALSRARAHPADRPASKSRRITQTEGARTSAGGGM